MSASFVRTALDGLGKALKPEAAEGRRFGHVVSVSGPEAIAVIEGTRFNSFAYWRRIEARTAALLPRSQVIAEPPKLPAYKIAGAATILLLAFWAVRLVWFFSHGGLQVMAHDNAIARLLRLF